MTTPYKVVVVGMGKRGKHHAAAFQANENFEVAGICDIDEARLAEAAMELRDMIAAAGVKAVVSHQHRYGPHYSKVKEIAALRDALPDHPLILGSPDHADEY